MMIWVQNSADEDCSLLGY